MSNENSPENAGPTKPAGKGIIIALFAGVLGLAAGAGLYALTGQTDNTQLAASSADGGCAYSDETRATLNAAGTGEVAAFQALDRPYSVTKLPFNDADGNPKTLADWQGKTVLLNLWATWCAPCRKEMPALDALHKTLSGEKFDVLAISVDLGDDAKPKKFYKDINISHMGFFHDGDLATLNMLKKDGLAFGLPATLLINNKGCVLGTLNGPAEWAGTDAQNLVKAAMALQ